MSASVARQALLPFTLLYAAGARFKNAAYDFRLLRPAHLAWPVVSVGNLSMGGAGKTSMVLLLARLLSERGWQVDVLSRGYGRASKTVAQVDPNGGVLEFGDEPLLMARHGLPVYVGAERFQAGLLAERETSRSPDSRPRLHLLDDGFQHRRLARDIDIVLVQRSDLTDDVLPVGRLRDPLSALVRADICVLRAEDAGLTARVMELMRTEDGGRIWQVERKTLLPEATPRRAFAFCALGQPQGFFQGLRHAGIDLQATLAFRDHHRFDSRDVERIRTVAQNCEAECIITTEKDGVRLPPALRDSLQAQLPLIIARLQVALLYEANSMTSLLDLLARKLQLQRGGMR